MNRTTIMLPENLKQQAGFAARKLGMSLGGFIRRSLERSLQRAEREPMTTDPLLDDTRVFTGAGDRDASTHHDQHLYGDRP